MTVVILAGVPPEMAEAATSERTCKQGLRRSEVLAHGVVPDSRMARSVVGHKGPVLGSRPFLQRQRESSRAPRLTRFLQGAHDLP
jgi:hypothetical protein